MKRRRFTKPINRGQSNVAIITFALILFSAAFINAQAPSDFMIEAFGGSYGPAGSNYELVINTDGTCVYYWSDLDSDSTYDITTTITTAQLNALYDTVTAVSFFTLNNLYQGPWIDGSGIILRITANNQVHSVEAKNYELVALNRIVWFINSLLSSSGIDLKYHFRGN